MHIHLSLQHLQAGSQWHPFLRRASSSWRNVAAFLSVGTGCAAMVEPLQRDVLGLSAHLFWTPLGCSGRFGDAETGHQSGYLELLHLHQ